MAGPSVSTSTPTNTQTSGGSSPVGGKDVVQNNGGTTLSTGGGTLNLTADPQVTGQAFDAVAAILNQALQQQNKTGQAIVDSNGQNNNALNQVLSQVLAKDAATASNIATGGASGQQSFILWGLGIAAAAAIAIAALFKKKSHNA